MSKMRQKTEGLAIHQMLRYGFFLKHKLFLFFFMLSLSAFVPAASYACRCAQSIDWEDRADLIFSGTSLVETEIAHSMLVHRFSALKTTKINDKAKEIVNDQNVITILQPLSPCNERFEKGKSYSIRAVVAESASGTSYLKTDGCFENAKIYTESEALGTDAFKDLFYKNWNETQGGLPPPQHIEITEEQNLVAGLFETLGIQIFKVSIQDQKEPLRYFLYDGTIDPIISFGGSGLMSALISPNAQTGSFSFYYTYSFGSGLHRSHIGHMYRGGDRKITKQVSGLFASQDVFVLIDDNKKVKVQSGTFNEINKWTQDNKLNAVVDQSETTEIKLITEK